MNKPEDLSKVIKLVEEIKKLDGRICELDTVMEYLKNSKCDEYIRNKREVLYIDLQIKKQELKDAVEALTVDLD
jgi:phage host-nuclease inhibitor protein Gam